MDKEIRARLAISFGMKRAIGETQFDMCISVARCCDAWTIQTPPPPSDDGWEKLGLPEPSCSLFDLVLIAEQMAIHIIVRCVSTALDLSGLSAGIKSIEKRNVKLEP